MASKKPAEPKPINYGEAGEHITFTNDQSGKGIVVRPNQFVAPTDVDGGRLNRAVAEVLGETPDAAEWVTRVGDAPGRWSLFRVLVDVEIPVLVEGLRRRGIKAQPNHVYFVNSLSTQSSFQTNPNVFAPNLLAPNLLAPNLLAPNLLAPNLLAANWLAPNLLASGMGGCGCGCGCESQVFDSGTRQVPTLGARPTQPPKRPAAAAIANPRVEVHIIDVATPGTNRPTDHETGELEAGNHLNNHAIDENGDGWADPAMAHGDFIKSIVCMQSGLTATLWQAADPLGAIDDVHLVQALDEVDKSVGTSASKRKVLNLSLGGYNENDQPGALLAEQVEKMIAGGWLIVASAGNNASCRLSWPAALPGVISVSAYGPCGPAWFSNYGPWVDVCALGVDVVAEYPKMTTEPEVNVAEVEDQTTPYGTKPPMVMLTTKDFKTGWATWSGTSFAAPLVAARLATHLQSQPVRVARADANEHALDEVIRDPSLPRIPYFGAVIE